MVGGKIFADIKASSAQLGYGLGLAWQKCTLRLPPSTGSLEITVYVSHFLNDFYVNNSALFSENNIQIIVLIVLIIALNTMGWGRGLLW